jgi:hypothetical protein
MIRRRDFIAALGGAAAWPLAARAQQDRVRRIGVLMPYDENDPVAESYVSAFTQALAASGWTDGRNVRIDLRWGGADINRTGALAKELLGLRPDIIVTGDTPTTVAVQRETRTIPIVFAGVGDPVAGGLVVRVNQPGGNTTGFALFEPTLGGKWLELLWEIAPGLKRAAIMFNPDSGPVSRLCPHLRRRPGHSRSCRSLRTFIATQRSKRASSPWGASRVAGLSSCRVYSSTRIARRSYRRRPETTYRRSMRHLSSGAPPHFRANRSCVSRGGNA